MATRCSFFFFFFFFFFFLGFAFCPGRCLIVALSVSNIVITLLGKRGLAALLLFVALVLSVLMCELVFLVSFLGYVL